MIRPKPGTYVAGLAAQWAATDPQQHWIHQAPDAPTAAEDLTADTVDSETIGDYLASRNPFPDDSVVEVAIRADAGEWKSAIPDQWERAEILERVGPGEWLVEYPDGEQGYRDTSELRTIAATTPQERTNR